MITTLSAFREFELIPVHTVIHQALDQPVNTVASRMWRLGLRTSVNSNGLSSGLSSHFAANAFRLLPIELVHVAQVAKLPLHHRDPFDRLLVAQALREKPAIVSADPIFRKYGARRLW